MLCVLFSAWFIAVQTLMTFALVFEFIGLVLFPLANHDGQSTRNLSLACVLSGVTSKCTSLPHNKLTTTI